MPKKPKRQPAEEDIALTSARRRRGVTRSSVTRLIAKFEELENNAALDSTPKLEVARQIKTRLSMLDADFRTQHLDVVDLVESEDVLAKEQAVLDEHDDRVTELASSIQCLLNGLTSSALSPKCSLGPASGRSVASRRLQQIQDRLSAVGDNLSTPSQDYEIRQIEEEIADIKLELRSVSSDLATLNLPEDDDLFEIEKQIRSVIYAHSLSAKKALAGMRSATPTLAASSSGVKLPKIDVPRFNGNVLSWRSFWEQFNVTIHSRTTLTDTEKMTYLQSSIKDSPAKSIIDGLSQSGDNYMEAIETLKARYDRPRLVHQAHVRSIVEAPGLKDGNGRELRRLHDTVQQHLRALKAMDCEPSGQFVTSLLELKLDENTMFEWQRSSQERSEVPHYSELLKFIDMRAQASEAKASTVPVKHFVKQEHKKPASPVKPVHVATPSELCIACKTTKHPLHHCSTFRALPHNDMVSLLKANNLCLNCFKSGHFVRQCPSLHRCRRCQGPHHTLLHIESNGGNTVPEPPPPPSPVNNAPSYVATDLKTDSLLMTCRVIVKSPSGLTTEARGLLDSGSSVSFITERLAQHLHLSRSRQSAQISGVAGLSHHSHSQSVASLSVSSAYSHSKEIPVTAIVVPRITCDLPTHRVSIQPNWKHLSGLQLSDPTFGKPDRIDLLLGVDVFCEAMKHGRRRGTQGSPTAFETTFGWVLAGSHVPQVIPSHHAISLHTSALSGDDLLRKFWEIEERINNSTIMSAEESCVVKHFQENHTRTADGKFVVPLPIKQDAGVLGESRSTAVRRFLSLERSLHFKGQFGQFAEVIQEYFDMGHAERVPSSSMHLSVEKTFYLPMHAVRKGSSTTTKIRAVFDASAKTSSGISLNDLLLVGPTVHSTLIDVLLRFRTHRVALTTDVSRMYRAVLLPESDRDLHRFVWRKSTSEPLQDYRMTRITFGVSSSSFTANMCVKQNALDLASEFPLASKAVHHSFYVDDGLTGADSINDALNLQKELQTLFARAGFHLRKWNTSESAVLKQIPAELRDASATQEIREADVFTRTLGIEWSASEDYFRLTVGEAPSSDSLTKRKLVSEIAKIFDVLGWFAPCIVSMKILLQRVWERKTDWDDLVPFDIKEAWEQWRSELDTLSTVRLSRCYYLKSSKIVDTQLHGFSDASEDAYAGVVYLRSVDESNHVHISLVTSKTKVSPIKRLSIPRLELCGANLLADILNHVSKVLGIPIDHIHAWTDSTIVLSWLEGNPRRFKTYVGNRVSRIIDVVPPTRWKHVTGMENPADCASRGVLPSQLVDHNLWWSGPEWLRLDAQHWPKSPGLLHSQEADELYIPVPSHVAVIQMEPAIPVDRFSSFSKLVRVTAWINRFIFNCRARCEVSTVTTNSSHCLSLTELKSAERYWISFIQKETFSQEIISLKSGKRVLRSSSLKLLNPFLDDHGLLRVGGREQHSTRSYDVKHPLIVHSRHHLVRLLIISEHVRLLHAGPTLLSASLSARYHIVRGRSVIRSVTRNCVICRRKSARPLPPLMGQLPSARVTPDIVFSNVGVDYAGPVLIKLGAVRRPTVVKAYIAVFVSLSVKAVHLELVSNLSTEAFLACLRRFVSRRGKPSTIWSDHGTNFVGANRQLKDLYAFLRQHETEQSIASFCGTEGIDWSFIPEKAPHFGGLWEAAVKSTKRHLSRILGETRLSFEELSTVLTQVEACLNSRPLTPLPSEEEISVLTPGHFLIGKPLQAIPNPPSSSHSITTLRRWELCQQLVQHFWKRWSSEYLTTLQKLQKWHSTHRNIVLGDIVIIRDDVLVPGHWPLARVTKTYPGDDGVVRAVTVQTARGTYNRPVHKLVLILPQDGTEL